MRKKTFKHLWNKLGSSFKEDHFCLKCEKYLSDLEIEIRKIITNGYAKEGRDVSSDDFDMELESTMDDLDLKDIEMLRPCLISPKEYKLKALLK